MHRGRAAPATPTPAWRRTAVIAALALAVLLAALILPGPVAAADESATFKLTGIHESWSAPTSAAATAPRIDKITHDANGGSIEFTMRNQVPEAWDGIPPTTPPTDECAGQKVQHFKFSWQFNKDVSTVSGRQGDNLFIISTKWEGDSGTKCLDENPFVWIRSGGSWGTGPGQGVTGETFKLAFVNPSGENRVYFDGSGSSNPTVSFNSINYDNGGFMFTPAIRFLNAQLDIVYAYDKVPGAPTMTATTAPQTTVATATTVPGGTTSGTGGGPGGCSWAGTWSTDWGQMTLTQSGNRVTGTYEHDAGRFEGTISGNTVTGRWSESPSYTEPNDAGQAVLTMASDCGSFSGTWGYGTASSGSGSWSGTRAAGTVVTTQQTTPPTVTTTRTTPPTTTSGGGTGSCSWAGTWQTNFGEMYLSQSGTTVTGTYVWDNGRIEGTVSGNTLTGRWSESPSYTEPNDAGQFVFTMASDCGSFTGTAGYGSSSTGIAQSGTRGGAAVTTSAPTTTPPTTTLPTTTPPTTAAATTTSSGGSSGGGTGGGTTGGTIGRNTCPASGMLLYIDPWTPAPGQIVEIPVWCCNAQDLANMDLTVLYNPAVLTFVSARKGGLLGSDFLFESNDLGGQVKISFAGTKGVYGSGAIAILTFKVAGATGASTTIGPKVNTASNSNGGSLTVPTEGGTVTVTPPNPNNPEGRPCGPTALTALKALQMAVGKIPMDMAYDVTRDGTVNSADARELLRLATEEVCVL